MQMSQKQGWGASGVPGTASAEQHARLTSSLQQICCQAGESRFQHLESSQLLVVGKIISLPVSLREQKQVLLYAGVLPCRRKVFGKLSPAGP